MPEDKYQRWIDALVEQTIDCAGVATRVYSTKPSIGKPTLLLIHGITGDRHGMAAYGFMMASDANVVIVEMPGHGKTDVPEGEVVEIFIQWSRTLLPKMAQLGIKVDGVIAHSMGCYAAQHIHGVPVLLCNPVLRASVFARVFQRQVRSLGRFASGIHSWYPWAVYRGYHLLSIPTEHNRTLIRWISRSVTLTPEQFSYNMNLVWLAHSGAMIADEVRAIDWLGILVGERDELVDTDVTRYSDFAPQAIIYQLDLGHLSVIEDPVATSRIAKLFFDVAI